MSDTLADNLQRLTASRTAIGNAIVAKGGTVNAGDGFEDFPADISSIPTGGSSTLIPKTITENGTYNPSSDNADGYSSVVANVPNTYVAGDEGKVVNNGALVAQTAMPNEITVNNTYDTTLYDSITVNVPSSPTPTPVRTELVRFMDYDGTILHTYTANEFLALSAMPENPTHDGLTSQGWNWSFEDAVEYVTTNRNLDIGQSYVTDDGRTRIYISLENPDLISPTLGLYLAGNSSVDVDWGDGSEHDTMANTSTSAFVSKITAQHTYPAVGNYVISIAVIEGRCSIGGSSTESHLLTDNKTSFTSTDNAYILSIKKVEIGNDISSVNDNAFRELRSLETITLPVNFYDFHSYTFQNCYSLKAVVIPKNSSFTTGQSGSVFHTCQSLTNVSLPKESYICGYMFINCYNLTRITIPLGRTTIGAGSSSYSTSSFYKCYNLSDVTIPEGITDINNTAFQECDSLTHITLPSTLSVINGQAFYQCNLIGELELPASLTSIGNSAFYNCRNLNSVVFENGTSDLTIGSSAFGGCTALDTVKLPTNLKTIGSNAFTGCSALKEMDIPDSVTSIGAELCKDCSSLVSVKIGSGITTLSIGCFRNCASLTAVDIPVTVKTMNERVFYDCKTLKTITLHDGLQEINGGSVFENCQSLESIELPDSVTKISGSSLLSGCTTLKHAKLPKSLTTFNPGYTFNHCYLLTSFTFPETVTTIPSSYSFTGGIFGDCWSLTSIDIPSWLTTIGSSAISACYSLTELTIPSTVTLIASNGIRQPGALKRLRFVSSTPPTTQSSSFTSIPTDCVILVPYGSLTAYTTASYYPNPSTYSYIEYATYPNGDSLPSSIPGYSLTWYATIEDWMAGTNPITVGNGNEVYVKNAVVTSITRETDFVNNVTTRSTDGVEALNVYRNMKRCNVDDDGTINAYDGDITYTEDGSNGQVMVKVNKFYYKLDVSQTGDLDGVNIRKGRWSIADTKLDNSYKLHPAFLAADGITELDYFLYGAFDAVGQDENGVYNTSYNTTTYKLGSVGGNAYAPSNNFTRAVVRTMATNRGAGWFSAGVKQTMAIQMLMSVEYGFNSQLAIGQGITNDSAVHKTGQTVGSITSGTQANQTTAVNYRGIENFWGNIWNWIDGLNFSSYTPYVCDTYTFVDDTTTGYTRIGFNIPNANYITALGYDTNNDWIMLPSEASSTANPSGPIGDRVGSNSGLRVPCLGGRWRGGSYAGAFYWACDNGSSSADTFIGARLMFIPQTV